MPRRLQREGATLEEIRLQLRRDFGDRARIVDAERVITGGMAGFFGRMRIEATVEVDEPAGDPVVFSAPARAGIAALLEDAEADDEVLTAAPPEPVTVSTAGSGFDALLGELTAATGLPPVPRVLHGGGDLVAVVGLETDIWSAAVLVAGSVGAGMTAITQSARGPGPQVRRHAVAARAAGVHGGSPAFLTVTAADPAGAAAQLAVMEPDQVWAVVDAGRKPADTARWVSTVRAAVPVHGVVAVGAASTATPATVEELGLPVWWAETARN